MSETHYSAARRWWGSVLLCACLVLPFGARAQEAPPALRESIEQAIAKVKPALVRLHVVTLEYQEGREMKYDISGSGAIISKEGHIVTNHHVAGHAARVFCTLTTKEEIEAEVVGVDPLTDLTVIKLKGAPGREYPVALFGDSAALKVGDGVLAMGSPLALSQSVTYGIVSNVEMTMPDWMRNYGDLKQDGEEVGSLVKWIGHDAEIHGGNSGGPLVNLAGEIVGINEISMGLAGAIPGNLAKEVVRQLLSTGTVKRAWLGVTLQPRLKDATTEGKQAPDRGVLINGVMKDSPAAAAGLRAGDIMLRVNDIATDARYQEQLPDINMRVSALPLGQEAVVTVLRDGAETSVKLVPMERPKAKLQETELKQWGLTVSDISFVTAREMKRQGDSPQNQEGVLITSVRPGGPSGDAKPNLAPRDIIVEVAGKPVKNLIDLVAITDSVMQGKTEPTPVLTVFERRTERYLTVVKVGIKELEDPGAEVKKAWLPIETQVITRTIAECLGNPALKGFRVTQVYKGTTAEKADLRVGDMILAVDDQKMTASAPEHYEELAALIRQYRVGDTVKLAVQRGTEQLSVPVELVRAPMLSREMKEYRNDDFEFTVREICFFDKAKEQWKDEQQGVMVSDVKPGGWAALGKLNVGDLVVSLDGTPVGDVGAFQEKMKALTAAKPAFVTLQVLRGIYTVYVQLEPKWDDKR